MSTPHPATQPQPATLQDYLHAEHEFYLMRKYELDRQSGMQRSAAPVGEVK